MGDPYNRFTDDRSNASLRPKRRSLLNRITDSLSSFLPSSFFESKPVELSVSPKKCRRLCSFPDSSPSRLINSSQRKFGIPTASAVPCIPKCTYVTDEPNPEVNVDLDAKDDASDASMDSKTSISTSGVSSLLPHCSRSQMCSSNDFTLLPISKKNGFLHSNDAAVNSRPSGSTSALWTNRDNGKRPSDGNCQPTSKRIRTESSTSCLSNPFSSPFYRGKTAYGGAASLRQCPQFRNIFEHVAPLRFIVETSEEKSPRQITQETSNAMLSATAKRILESLERHSSPISATDKIPLPRQLPITPTQSLQSRTIRYPPYMAAFRRFKTSQHRPVPSVCDTHQQQITVEKQCNQSRPHSFGVDETHTDTLLKPASTKKSASFIGLKQHPPSIVTSVADAVVPTSFDLNAPVLKINGSTPFSKRSQRVEVKPLDDLSGISSTFKFSRPISLKVANSFCPAPSVSPRVHYTFSLPKSCIKVPAPNDKSSFLPVLLATRSTSNISMPSKKSSNTSIVFWRCESCLTENSNLETACKSCRLPKPLSTQFTPKQANAESCAFAPFGTMNGPPSLSKPDNKWECPSCMVHNDADASACVCCQTTRSPVDTKYNSLDSSSKIGPESLSLKSWECPSCMVVNRGEHSVCVCCQTKRDRLLPSVVAASTNFGTEGEGVVGKSSTEVDMSSNWDCPTCMVSNKTSVYECSCCQTKKPGMAEASKDSAFAKAPTFQFGAPVQSKSVFSFGQPLITKHDSSNWDCPSCMVSNKTSLNACPCCQTKKPGSFGAPLNAPELTTPKFSFGAPTTSIPSGTDSPPLIVSNIKASTNSTLFNFGSPANKLCFNASPPFSFDVASVSSSNGTSTPASGRNVVPTNSTPSFSLGFKPANFSVVKPSTSFAFGVSPKPIEPTNNLFASKLSLPNGVPSTSSLSSFGVQASVNAVNKSVVNTSPTSIPPTYSFGATPMKENVTPKGFNFMDGALFPKSNVVAETSPSVPTLFKFGESNQPPSTTPFHFNAINPGNSIFSVPSASQPSSGVVHTRPIRRAVRRFQKS